MPAGASISSAVLQLNCTNFGNMMRIYRLTQSWNENEATWNQRSLGVAWGAPGADGTASRVSTYVNGDCTVTGLRSIDITSLVQEWSNGSPNYGVVVTDTGTDGIDFGSSESASSPVLTVQYPRQPDAGRDAVGQRHQRGGQLHHDPAAGPDLFLERAGDRHPGPAGVGAGRLLRNA